MGPDNALRDAIHQPVQRLPDEAQVGDVEEDVLHEAGRPGVGVGGGQHEVPLGVEAGVEGLQPGYHTALGEAA